MNRHHPLSPLIAVVALVACGDRGEAQNDDRVYELAQEVIPQVERAVGLPFKRPPAIALRTRAQVQDYLAHKLDAEFPPDELKGITVAYRLFGLLPDTVDLRALLLALYTEQVAGYFDPDSSTLYVVTGSDPVAVRLVLAHELVHALQDQYVALDSLLAIKRANDRLMAAQAVLEGQATLASITALMPDRDYNAMPEFWRSYRQALKQQHELMPVFSSAPLVIRESLVFPYLAGADFVRWFRREHGDTVPFGPRLPTSTEHILHPDRYRSGDAPVALRFVDAGPALYEDGLGEFETRILLTELTGSESTGSAGALSWGGDRYAVFPTPSGEYALVWWSVWDTERAANRFATLLKRVWPERAALQRRYTIDRVSIDGHEGVRLVDAPAKWADWANPPGVVVK